MRLRTVDCWLATIVGLVMMVSSASSGGAKAFVRPSGSASTGSQDHGELSKLLELLRSEEMRRSEPERVVAAIERLGELRASAAIDDLIGLIAFRQRFPWEVDGGPINEIHPITTFEVYPAMGALLSIGKPGAAALLTLIADNDEQTVVYQNAVMTFREVFRYSRDEGEALVVCALEKPASPVAERRLRNALAELCRPDRKVP